jgi:hypothetical protein
LADTEALLHKAIQLSQIMMGKLDVVQMNPSPRIVQEIQDDLVRQAEMIRMARRNGKPESIQRD